MGKLPSSGITCSNGTPNTNPGVDDIFCRDGNGGKLLLFVDSIYLS